MALRNISGRGRHIDARPTHPPQKRRIVNLDKKTREEVISMIENLSNEQWQILTRDLDNITREEFAMVCVGIVQQLTDATYKRSKLVNSHEKTSARAALHPSTIASPLESPQGNAVITEIVQEVKLALSAALDNSVSGKDSSSAITEGWSALFLQLEQETLNVLTARLDSSEFFARMTKASCPSAEDAQLDPEVKGSTGLTLSSEEGTMESSGQQPKAAAATSNAAEEDVISVKEEEVTTACTNEVISQICDVYESAELEEERLRAASEREEELSLVTSHFVDNVMIQLKELASAGKSVAFQWVPKDMCLPSVWASSAADQNILSPQFQIAAQQKVSKVLRQSMPGETPLGRVPSVATDIVGTIVRNLTNLPHSVVSLRSAEDRDDTTGTAQNIYHNVQSKVKDFLWSKKTSKQVSDSESSEGTLAYDTESSGGMSGEEVEEDDETSMEGERSEEDFHLKSSKDEVPLSHVKSKENQIKTVPEISWSRSEGGSTSEQKTPRRKADLELDLSKTSPLPKQTIPASRAPQHARRLPSIDINATRDYLRKLLCSVQADEQVRAEDITNVTKAETSTLHNTSGSHNSDIIVIMERTNSSENLVDSAAPGGKANLELDAGNNTQCSEETLSASRTAHPVGQLPPIDRNTTRDYWRKLLCCIKSDDQVKTEDVTEAGTSTLCNMAESHVSDIILIMDRETSLSHMQSES